MTCPHCDTEMSEVSPKWPVIAYHCLDCDYVEERDDPGPPPTASPPTWKGGRAATVNPARRKDSKP